MPYRICPICEAGCGLKISTENRTVTEIAPNPDDVFSTGHVCAKGLALAQLDADPDRLRSPLIRKDGELIEASYEEAFELITEQLLNIKTAKGANAIASYIGNPTAHNIGLSFGLGAFLASLGSTNIYSAGTVDQVPKQLASELMFGDDMALPVPDIERSDYLLMLGANPIVSNGSLWMVPGFRDKLRAFKDRGGTFVTVDPRFSETARLADHHYPIVPGTDAWLLAALINELIEADVDMPDRYPVTGWSALKGALRSFDIATAAALTGIAVSDIKSIAKQLILTASPVVYGRVGTTLQRHGTLTSFLIEVLNLMTGSLDRVGGAVFPEQPYMDARSSIRGAAPNLNRYQSRVSQRPEVLGQMPVSILAEEIETAGDNQINALVCFAGNPVVSNPDSDRLASALKSLDFLVCIDIYHNETTQLADVILPGTSPFEDGHYDSFLGSTGYRNVARYSPPVFKPDAFDEWQLGLALTSILNKGRPPTHEDIAATEDDHIAAAIARYCDDNTSPLYGRDVQEILGMIEPVSGVERLLDLGIRAGRYGDHFGKRPGLTLQQLIDNPNGIDLGPPRADRLKALIDTPSGAIELAPDIILQDLKTLAATEPDNRLRLIGKRGTRTNNSWLGNLAMLSRGSRQCRLDIHPDDATRHRLSSGDLAELSTSISAIVVEVRVTDSIKAGVVSLPHGFSETQDLKQHRQQRGANYNRLIPASCIDAPSGTSALNGYPVSIRRLPSPV